MSTGAARPRQSAELDLLLACARPLQDSATRERIEALTHGVLDWTLVVTLALRHEVTGLLHWRLDGHANAQVPPEIRQALSAKHAWWCRRESQLTDEALRLARDLERAGIETLFFKGPVLAATLYDRPGLRQFGDLDFLIHEPDIDRTLDVLSGNGYSPATRLSPAREAAVRRYSGQYNLVRDDGQVAVEPHWRFSHAMLAVALDHDAIWRRAVERIVDGVPLRTASEADTALLLCIHGCKEEWGKLKWVCDLASIAHRETAIDWHALHRDAARQGCGRMLRLGFALADRLLQTPVPEALRPAVDVDGAIASLVESVERSLTCPGSPKRTNFKIYGFKLRMRERLGDKLRYAARTLFTPRRAHYELVALPDALLFLYYPIRIAHDCLMLPLWLLAKRTARAFRAG
ncbi:MAG: nucleotidyltransferase family protein [Alphaproteobacteria bacterium]